MITNVKVECETIGELTSHFYEIIKQVKKEAKKAGKDHSDEFEADLSFDDDNCYGSHEVEICPDESPQPVPAKDWVFDYLRQEAEQQIPRMKALGINTDDQFFEQCVNALLMMLEKSKEAVPAQQGEVDDCGRVIEDAVFWNRQYVDLVNVRQDLDHEITLLRQQVANMQDSMRISGALVKEQAARILELSKYKP